MDGSLAFTFARLFIRFIVGILLLSVALSKLRHRRDFRRTIQDYQLIPATLEKSLNLSELLSSTVPTLELLLGITIISGILLIPALLLSILLFGVYTIALIINLRRGRSELSCGCGGILGNHRISWWMVGRNILLLAGLLLLLMTPPDPFQVDLLSGTGFHAQPVDWLSAALPAAICVTLFLAAIALLNAARVLWENPTLQ